jgi:cell division septation protein DedD
MMLHNGPSKRQFKAIWLQVGVSTFVLLLPLFVMAAGVNYLVSPSPRVSGPQQVSRARVTAQQLTDLAGERAEIWAEHSDVRSDAAAVTLVDTGQRLLSGKNSDGLSTNDGEITVATANVSAKALEQVRIPRRRVSSLTLSVEAPQTTEATAPVVAAPSPSQPSPAVAQDPPGASTRTTPGINESDSWVVQLSAQRTEAEAQSAFRAAQTKFSMLAGHQLLIRKKDQGERGVFYAAQLGPLSRTEANQLCSKLKSAGGSCFIQRN